VPCESLRPTISSGSMQPTMTVVVCDESLRARQVRRHRRRARPRYGRALENRCSSGSDPTPRAALRRALAVDVNERALSAARTRCAALPHVGFAACCLPDGFPQGRFDLVVLSEVAYYWSDADLALARDRIASSLEPAAIFSSSTSCRRSTTTCATAMRCTGSSWPTSGSHACTVTERCGTGSTCSGACRDGRCEGVCGAAAGAPALPGLDRDAGAQRSRSHREGLERDPRTTPARRRPARS